MSYWALGAVAVIVEVDDGVYVDGNSHLEARALVATSK